MDCGAEPLPFQFDLFKDKVLFAGLRSLQVVLLAILGRTCNCVQVHIEVSPYMCVGKPIA